MNYDLNRFKKAQNSDYEIALKEIRNGRKESHWIWYIFPQLKGLGRSYYSDYYGIENLEEAREYMKDESLRANLLEITNALLDIKTDNILEVMDNPDDFKLKSSMTLFKIAAPEYDVFEKVLDKFFDGKLSRKTLNLLDK